MKHVWKHEEAEQGDEWLPILEGCDEESGSVVSIQGDEEAMPWEDKAEQEEEDLLCHESNDQPPHHQWHAEHGCEDKSKQHEATTCPSAKGYGTMVCQSS